MTKADFSPDWQGDDPPVDRELRQMMQSASAEPTAEDMARFWQDLEPKLDTAASAAHKARWLALPRVYMPWLGAASGLLVVLMLLVPRHAQEPSTSYQDQAQTPMTLGAAPEAESLAKSEPPASLRREAQPKKQKFISEEQAPLFLSVPPDFPVRWERLSEQLFLLRFAPAYQADFLEWSKALPENITVRQEKVDPEAAGQEWVYRVEYTP